MHPILSTVISSGGARFAVAALSVLFSFIVANSYGLATLGAFTLATSIVIGLSLVSRMGFEHSILKLSGSKTKYDGEFYGTLRNTLVMSFVLGLVVTALAYPLAYLLAERNPETSRFLQVLLLLIPFWSMNFIIAQLLNGIGRPNLAPLYEPSGSVALLTVLLVVTNTGLQRPIPFYVVVVTYAGLPVAASMIGWLCIARARRTAGIVRIPLRRTFSQLREENFDFFVSAATAYMFSVGLFPLIGLFLDNSALGFFRLCERLATTISLILIVINSVLGPRYAFAWQAGHYRQLARLYKGSVLLGLALALPPVVLILVFAEQLIKIVAESGVENLQPDVLRILVIAMLVNVLAGGSQPLLYMTGHHGFARNVSLVMLPIGVALFVTLTSVYGVHGAATAFLAYTLCSNALRLVGVRTRILARQHVKV